MFGSNEIKLKCFFLNNLQGPVQRVSYSQATAACLCSGSPGPTTRLKGNRGSKSTYNFFFQQQRWARAIFFPYSRFTAILRSIFEHFVNLATCSNRVHTIPHPFSTPFPVSSLFLLPIFLWIIAPASCPCPHPMSTFLNPPPFCSPPPLGHPIYPRFPPLFYIFPALFIFSFSPFSIPHPLSYFSFDSKRSNSEMMRQICLLNSYISFSIFSIYHRV